MFCINTYITPAVPSTTLSLIQTQYQHQLYGIFLSHNPEERDIFKAKYDFIQQKIKNTTNNQKAQFAALDELLYRSKSNVLPDHQSQADLADWFASFFTEKVCKIQKELGQLSSASVNDSPCEHAHLSTFKPVTVHKQITNILDSYFHHKLSTNVKTHQKGFLFSQNAYNYALALCITKPTAYHSICLIPL